jgi:hypothetical protein
MKYKEYIPHSVLLYCDLRPLYIKNIFGFCRVKLFINLAIIGGTSIPYESKYIASG